MRKAFRTRFRGRVQSKQRGRAVGSTEFQCSTWLANRMSVSPFGWINEWMTSWGLEGASGGADPKNRTVTKAARKFQGKLFPWPFFADGNSSTTTEDGRTTRLNNNVRPLHGFRTFNCLSNLFFFYSSVCLLLCSERDWRWFKGREAVCVHLGHAII